MIAHSLYVLRQVIADLKQEATPEELREAADEIGKVAKELYSLARDAVPWRAQMGHYLNVEDGK